MTDTQQIIDYCVKRISSANVNSHRSNTYPTHLHGEINRIKHLYETTGHISMADEQFLKIMSNSNLEWLNDHAYILGKWTPFKSYRHKNYNLQRKYGTKSVKKIKRPQYYSNL